MALPQTTQVRIYNRALALVGTVNRTTSLDDEYNWTEQLNALWPDAVRELLAEHPWNFAIKRATRTKQADADDDNGRLYSLPADCLRWLPPARDDEHWFEGVQEGHQLLVTHGDTDETIRIRYISEETRVELWPPHFVTAMAHRLAMDAAESFTQSAQIKDELKRQFEGLNGEGGILAKAKRADGLATGDRSRGSVSVRSRALRAAGRYGFGSFDRPVPGDWDYR